MFQCGLVILLASASAQDHPYIFNIGGGPGFQVGDIFNSYNAGAGITFRVGDSYVKFYSELRYHHAFHRGIDTQVLPLTFGIRY